MVAVLILLATGLAAGTLGGLLGIGGGIVLMPILRFVIGLPAPESAGVCILAVFFTTLGGSYRHYRLGHIEIRSVVPVMFAGIVSSAACSALFPEIARYPRWLDLGVGLVFALVCGRMILEGLRGLPVPTAETPRGRRVEGPTLPKTMLGVASGALPGLLGIGTGGVLVPGFAFLMRAPIKTATAASLTCFCCNAAVSSGFKLTQGFVDLHSALPLCGATFVGANLGAIINRRFPPAGLRLLFGIAFAGISLRFVAGFLQSAPQ